MELTVKSKDDFVLPIEQWLSQMDRPIFFNVINDLIVNGVAVLDDKKVVILYDDISQLDEFEYSTLNLPELYPFDIFVDIVGSGLKDSNLKICYSFQDFAHKNGSGNILFNQNQLKGAHLKSTTEYLLNSNQFLLIKEIESINSSTYSNSSDTLKAIANLQSIALNANAVLSKVLLDTIILAPNKLKLEIEKVGEDKFRLNPVIKDVDTLLFQKKFKIHSQVKKEYTYKKDNKKTRIVIDDVKNEDNNSMQTELLKLKEKNTFSSKEINDRYNSPTKFWDADLIDLDDFGARVLELGIYKPKFYPFITPYKSQWIPGIAIEDKRDGRRLVTIKDSVELIELKNLLSESKKRDENSIIFKDVELDIAGVPAIIENATKQLNSPNRPITNSKKENKKSESQTRVLIIKENRDQVDYSETAKVISDIAYSFKKIDNLSTKIQLKDHQRDGVAWLQTLSQSPYSLSGVLLADDMGLGKTLQVLYFIEWYVQNINTKPVLVVAPVSLLENWENEYLKFFPNPSFNTATLWGSNVRNYIVPNDKEKTISNLSNKSIFLTTYETLRKQQISLALINWGVIILDEAQKIKTPGTIVTNAAKALKSDFKIAMTGTPVENTLMDLWCIMDFCRPGLLDNRILRVRAWNKHLEV